MAPNRFPGSRENMAAAEPAAAAAAASVAAAHVDGERVAAAVEVLNRRALDMQLLNARRLRAARRVFECLEREDSKGAASGVEDAEEDEGEESDEEEEELDREEKERDGMGSSEQREEKGAASGEGELRRESEPREAGERASARTLPSARNKRGASERQGGDGGAAAQSARRSTAATRLASLLDSAQLQNMATPILLEGGTRTAGSVRPGSPSERAATGTMVRRRGRAARGIAAQVSNLAEPSALISKLRQLRSSQNAVARTASELEDIAALAKQRGGDDPARAAQGDHASVKLDTEQLWRLYLDRAAQRFALGAAADTMRSTCLSAPSRRLLEELVWFFLAKLSLKADGADSLAAEEALVRSCGRHYALLVAARARSVAAPRPSGGRAHATRKVLDAYPFLLSGAVVESLAYEFPSVASAVALRRVDIPRLVERVVLFLVSGCDLGGDAVARWKGRALPPADASLGSGPRAASSAAAASNAAANGPGAGAAGAADASSDASEGAAEGEAASLRSRSEQRARARAIDSPNRALRAGYIRKVASLATLPSFSASSSSPSSSSPPTSSKPAPATAPKPGAGPPARLLRPRQAGRQLAANASEPQLRARPRQSAFLADRLSPFLSSSLDRATPAPSGVVRHRLQQLVPHDKARVGGMRTFAPAISRADATRLDDLVARCGSVLEQAAQH